MVTRRSYLALLPVFLLAAVTLVGCAKRPAVMMTGAPPPTGLSSATQGGTTSVVVSEATATTSRSSAVVVTEQVPASTTTATTTTATESVAAQSSATTATDSASAQSTAMAPPAATAPAAPAAQSEGTDRQIAAAPAAQEAPSASPSSTIVAQTTPRPDQRDFQPMTQLEAIYFDFDRSDIRPDAVRVLQANANWFRSNPNHLILIEGHCDERGTNDYNLALGERRARSTMNYLIAQGVESRRMTVVSYGEERPACTEQNESCWSKNRRAAFLVKETVPSALPAAVIGPAPAATSSGPAPSKTTGPTESATDPVSSPSRPGLTTPPNPVQRQAP